ncbi:hypothetical protein [Streptomyces sp. 3214.6]|uniref:hypothetical protein n=1 Tax=Streptomyces sp. 3214.6 TaxID=1882757 RepID=UPI00090C10FF|nr:hypothetical protein [Streptomyces sp. 3214.6]SHI66127.1 hypothetical protein SAMN05444521_8167 [Streptomyces sp. 3214.6]
MIENTSESMKDPGNALLFLAVSLGPGGTDRAIAEQERSGQAQLVNSDRLPSDMNGASDADFEAVGITFGEPDPADPLFRPATLPEGWKRQRSDHDMWSYVADELGRRRVAVFYKAAFYDRRAFMRLVTVEAYVSECRYEDREVVTDGTWATPAAVVEAARRLAQAAQASVDQWTQIGERRGSEWAEKSAKYVAEYTAERDSFEAIASRFEKAAEA